MSGLCQDSLLHGLEEWFPYLPAHLGSMCGKDVKMQHQSYSSRKSSSKSLSMTPSDLYYNRESKIILVHSLGCFSMF